MASTDQRRSRHHDESPTKPNKKKASHNPEKNLFVNLHSCSKSKDLSAALALYDGAITSTDIRLSQQHFQTLLYLCSASISDPSLQTLAIDRGFQIFDRMVSSAISPNESSVTAVARLAAAKGDGDYAFKKRVNALLENPNHGNLVEEWINNNVLYATPPGSNDDWYWLYAAAKLKCLLVTNDEMRDHIFELLSNSFFQKWKERHQVRFTFVKGCLKLEMPPPFSVVIQESEKGSWHFPITCQNNEESLRSWICITRQSI